MSITPAERAKLVVRYLAKKEGISQAQIGQQVGYFNKSSFSAVLNGNKIMPKKFGEKLAALDPEINPEFLSGSSDEMLIPGSEQPTIPEMFSTQKEVDKKPTGVFMPTELIQMFSDLSATIRSQQETIRLLVQK